MYTIWCGTQPLFIPFLQLTSNPEVTRQLMDNPMINGLMTNGDLMRRMIER
jgi:hypothetical protein